MTRTDMTDIELVIKIPKEIYKNIQSKSTEIQAKGYILENAVLNGTPIPNREKESYSKMFNESEDNG